MKHRWHSVFRSSCGKVSGMEIGFLLWLLCVCIAWTTMCLTTHTLAEIPSTVVNLTLALGATKVTHRLAENDWESITTKIIAFVKEKFQRKKKPLTKKKKGVK